MVAQSLPDGTQEVSRWTSTLSRALLYKYLVANTMTTTPDQSAIALPKNQQWVLGLETLYRQIHKVRIPAEAMLNEC